MQTSLQKAFSERWGMYQNIIDIYQEVIDVISVLWYHKLNSFGRLE